MKRIPFTTTISAPAERVWDRMIGRDTYPIWTTPFGEGSSFEGSWQKGEKIRFLAAGGDGMVAEIAEFRPCEFISIRHLGSVKDGVETTEAWAPAYENYTLTERGGATEVRVDMDVVPDWEEFMTKTWPLALQKLKELCEREAVV